MGPGAVPAVEKQHGRTVAPDTPHHATFAAWCFDPARFGIEGSHALRRIISHEYKPFAVLGSDVNARHDPKM
jgi:hypothetical protein